MRAWMDTRTWSSVDVRSFHVSPARPSQVPSRLRQTLPHSYKFGLKRTVPRPVVRSWTLGGPDG